MSFKEYIEDKYPLVKLDSGLHVTWADVFKEYENYLIEKANRFKNSSEG